jgi:hypothetical protein
MAASLVTTLPSRESYKVAGRNIVDRRELGRSAIYLLRTTVAASKAGQIHLN